MAFSFENLKTNLANVAKKTGEVAEKAVRMGGEVAEKAVKKGTEVVGIAKLNISLNEREAELKKLFTELGILTYDKAEAAEIEALKAEIAAANGKVVCKCGKEIEDDATFCKYCGAKVEKPAPKAATEAEAPTGEPTEKADENVADSKPLSTDEFVDTFENVMDKYGFKK